MKNIVLVTMGDPAGIGPEIVVKAFAHPEIHEHCIPVVIGDRVCLQQALALTGRSSVCLREIQALKDASVASGVISYVNMDLIRPGEVSPGALSAACGRAAYAYIAEAVHRIKKGEACAIATAPINKEALHLAGCPHPGHTEILAALSGAQEYAMLLIGGGLRVIHCSTHLPLHEACAQLTAERVCQVIRLGYQALEHMGIESPRLAVSGLNPHASENGLFGDEEASAILPGIDLARQQGFWADGPIPPDSVFVRAMGGEYDLVVAMYHDQGHIPVKLTSFKLDPTTGNYAQLSGVNVTVGLPFVRTSVDHGTAFDRAGKNQASEQSLVEAICLAGKMAGNWGGNA